MTTERVKWTPYSGYYPLREEGWLMATEKPIDDNDPEPANDPVDDREVQRERVKTETLRETTTVASENDDDTEEGAK